MALRPPAIQAHIVTNRYLAILKNDTPRAFVRDLPFLVMWDLAVWGWLALRSPRTLVLVWRQRRLLGRALAKRRALRARAEA